LQPAVHWPLHLKSSRPLLPFSTPPCLSFHGGCPTPVPAFLAHLSTPGQFSSFRCSVFTTPGLSGKHERRFVEPTTKKRLPCPPGCVYQTRPARHYRFALPLPASASIRQSRTFISFFLRTPSRATPISPRSPQSPFLAFQPHSVRIDPVTPASSATGLHTRLVALLSTFLVPPRGERIAAGSKCDSHHHEKPKWESRNLGSEFRAIPCSTGEGSIGFPYPRPRLGYRVEKEPCPT